MMGICWRKLFLQVVDFFGGRGKFWLTRENSTRPAPSETIVMLFLVLTDLPLATGQNCSWQTHPPDVRNARGVGGPKGKQDGKIERKPQRISLFRNFHVTLFFFLIEFSREFWSVKRLLFFFSNHFHRLFLFPSVKFRDQI